MNAWPSIFFICVQILIVRLPSPGITVTFTLNDVDHNSLARGRAREAMPMGAQPFPLHEFGDESEFSRSRYFPDNTNYFTNYP